MAYLIEGELIPPLLFPGKSLGLSASDIAGVDCGEDVNMF